MIQNDSHNDCELTLGFIVIITRLLMISCTYLHHLSDIVLWHQTSLATLALES